MATISPPRIAVALISAAVLGYEILLMALFSLIQWHHFAYMVVSVALLGFGASGTFLVFTHHWLKERFRTVAIAQACLFATSSLACYIVAQRLSFNPEELLWDSSHWIRLELIFLLLALPFFFAANLIGLVLITFRRQLSRVYAADLTGAGFGALAIVGLLFLVQPSTALRIIAFSGFVAAAAVWLESGGALRNAIAGLLLAGTGLYALPASWTEPVVSPYKGLSQLLRVNGTRVVAERSSPLGRVTLVESPVVPLRYAPGLSLNSRTEPPAQLGLFINADGMTPVTRYRGNREDLAYLDDLTSALPYHLSRPKRVLVLGAGGGADVLQALYHGARQVDAVELDTQVVDLVRNTYGEFSGGIYDHDDVTVHIAEARGFLNRADENYDLIQIPLLDSFGSAASGIHGLNENHLYTIEALQQAMHRINDQGYLALTRWVKLPPRDTLKLFATATEALKQSGFDDISQRLVLIRGLQTSTLLIRKGLFSPVEINKLRDFCAKRAFDVAYYPGMPVAEANQYNLLDAPYFFNGATALLGNRRQAFLDSYKFDLQPASDNQPFYFHFVKWRSLPELISLRHRGGSALIETGYLTLLATLAQVIVLSIIIILIPLFFIRRESATQAVKFNQGKVLCYFLALGFGFLLIEIAFLQKFIQFLHHPLYSAAVVLGTFLVSAGAGSRFADRYAGEQRSLRVVRFAILVIASLGICYLWILGPLFQWAANWPMIAKILVTVALIAPLGFGMGMPFPLGLSSLNTASPSLVPWAWGINGCASVISAVLATLLAIHFGYNAVILTAVVCYLTAAVYFPGFSDG